MKKEINILELFSGIGGFTKGFEEAGYTIKNHYFSEIDRHAIACYKHNYPHAEYLGSVVNISGSGIRPDIITFGSPCQDFSLAGKRAGMDGQRSSLITQAIRIITELQPSVFIWENVKGTFSSNNGADFWAIIAAFANIGGYRLEWQLLNTSWFLPQNRERIYLVGHFAGLSRPGVFPIRENGGVFDKSQESNKGWPQATISTVISAGGLRADGTFIQVPKIAGCLTGGGHSGGLHSDMTTIKVRQLNNLKNFGGTSTKQQDRVYSPDGLMCCIPSSRAENKLNILIPHIQRTDEAKEIRKQSMKNGKDYTPFQGKKLEWKEGNTMNTITCATQKGNLIKIKANTKQGYEYASEGDSINFQNLNSKTRRGRVGKDKAQTLDTQANQGVLVQDKIRRLTEIECERLQGFPDDWTKWGNYEGKTKEIPKTQRYKMCGNAVTVDVVKAIAQRLEIED
jgi:DNA (cytosine-5)-methyltransferase 1